MNRKSSLTISLFCFLFVLIVAWDIFALPVRIHKFTGGTIELQMQPFSVPSAAVLDAKTLKALDDDKFDYLIIRTDATGKIVDYYLSNGFKQAEAYYLAKVKTDTKAVLPELKPGKTNLMDGKVTVVSAKPIEAK